MQRRCQLTRSREKRCSGPSRHALDRHLLFAMEGDMVLLPHRGSRWAQRLRLCPVGTWICSAHKSAVDVRIEIAHPVNGSSSRRRRCGCRTRSCARLLLLLIQCRRHLCRRCSRGRLLSCLFGGWDWCRRCLGAAGRCGGTLGSRSGWSSLFSFSFSFLLWSGPGGSWCGFEACRSGGRSSGEWSGDGICGKGGFVSCTFPPAIATCFDGVRVKKVGHIPAGALIVSFAAGSAVVAGAVAGAGSTGFVGVGADV